MCLSAQALYPNGKQLLKQTNRKDAYVGWQGLARAAHFHYHEPMNRRSWFRRMLAKPLWRVRNRLLFTYFLFGIVPLLLVWAMLNIAGDVLYGQYSADRVRSVLETASERMRMAGSDLAVAASQGTAEVFLDAQHRRIPGLRVVLREPARAITLPGTAELMTAPDWLGDDEVAVIGDDSHLFLAVRKAWTGGDVFAYLPFDTESVSALVPDVNVVVFPEHDADFNLNPGTGAFYRANKNSEWISAESKQPGPLPAATHSWDRQTAWIIPWPTRRFPDGERSFATLLVYSRSSLLFDTLFSSLGGFGTVAVFTLTAVGAVFLLMELTSLVWSLSLTRTITRSVHELYRGTQQVAAGKLDYRIPVRGHHQLSDLAGSFNSMTERVQQLIGEVRKKEKLEAELEIARQVQARLFPKSVPRLNTLELAARCIPSRFVSGDYYDFVPPDDRYMALALADISGKGIAAALLMASVQSALHAQLRFAGGMRAAAPGGRLSTADLMTRISQQLYENTPPEKYATFFLSLYDDETGRLLYTNAGHCPPILVQDGKAAPLEGNSLVVGLLPNASYEEQSIELHPGDLLAVFSDGVPEAENADGEQFGEERLSALLVELADQPLEEIVRAVTERVMGWAHDREAQDDTTILLARRL